MLNSYTLFVIVVCKHLQNKTYIYLSKVITTYTHTGLKLLICIWSWNNPYRTITTTQLVTYSQFQSLKYLRFYRILIYIAG